MYLEILLSLSPKAWHTPLYSQSLTELTIMSEAFSPHPYEPLCLVLSSTISRRYCTLPVYLTEGQAGYDELVMETPLLL